jgi:6-phosphogluconate dehydrogenase (decarboxylating)
MRTFWKRLAIVIGLVVWAAAPATAAEPRPVLSVLTVKVKGDQEAYLQKVKALNAISKRTEAGGTIRVWHATVAGTDTGLLYVGIEYPSMEAFAKGFTKVRADAEYQKLVKELDQSGTREIVSSSLLQEITP